MSSAGLAAAPPHPLSEIDERSTFAPRRWLANPHVMTVFAWASRRAFPYLPAPEARLFRVTADTQVLAHCYWQEARPDAPTLLALHGLEGSSSVHYMRGLAAKAWARGWNVVLLNQRNCGGTEHLTPSLYHSGLTSDPRQVIETLVADEGLRDFGVIGYSLGGNLTMKLAGELGDDPALPVRGVVAVCPTIDLERSVAAIERRSNIVYHLNFVRNLRGRMRRKALAWPGAFDLTPLDRIWTIRAFDDAYTAPHHGFGDARTYYHRASALRVVDRISVPALILAAADDPFVPPAQFDEPAVRRNSNVRVHISPHGGHCAFVADSCEAHDGYWAEAEALAFLAGVMRASARGRSPVR
jgi:hypothetical protein